MARPTIPNRTTPRRRESVVGSGGRYRDWRDLDTQSFGGAIPQQHGVPIKEAGLRELIDAALLKIAMDKLALGPAPMGQNAPPPPPPQQPPAPQAPPPPQSAPAAPAQPPTAQPPQPAGPPPQAPAPAPQAPAQSAAPGPAGQRPDGWWDEITRYWGMLRDYMFGSGDAQQQPQQWYDKMKPAQLQTMLEQRPEYARHLEQQAGNLPREPGVMDTLRGYGSAAKEVAKGLGDTVADGVLGAGWGAAKGFTQGGIGKLLGLDRQGEEFLRAAKPEQYARLQDTTAGNSKMQDAIRGLGPNATAQEVDAVRRAYSANQAQGAAQTAQGNQARDLALRDEMADIADDNAESQTWQGLKNVWNNPFTSLGSAALSPLWTANSALSALGQDATTGAGMLGRWINGMRGR